MNIEDNTPTTETSVTEQTTEVTEATASLVEVAEVSVNPFNRMFAMLLTKGLVTVEFRATRLPNGKYAALPVLVSTTPDVIDGSDSPLDAVTEGTRTFTNHAQIFLSDEELTSVGLPPDYSEPPEEFYVESEEEEESEEKNLNESGSLADEDTSVVSSLLADFRSTLSERVPSLSDEEVRSLASFVTFMRLEGLGGSPNESITALQLAEHISDWDAEESGSKESIVPAVGVLKTVLRSTLVNPSIVEILRECGIRVTHEERPSTHTSGKTLLRFYISEEKEVQSVREFEGITHIVAGMLPDDHDPVEVSTLASFMKFLVDWKDDTITGTLKRLVKLFKQWQEDHPTFVGSTAMSDMAEGPSVLRKLLKHESINDILAAFNLTMTSEVREVDDKGVNVYTFSVLDDSEDDEDASESPGSEDEEENGPDDDSEDV